MKQNHQRLEEDEGRWSPEVIPFLIGSLSEMWDPSS